MDMVEHLEDQEHPATIIKTLLQHAKIQVDQAAKTTSVLPVSRSFRRNHDKGFFQNLRKEELFAGRT